jgi:hypothetical protein
MRLYHKIGKLSESQVIRLKDIGFCFDIQESVWNDRLIQLSEYKAKHGDFFVPYADNPVRQASIKSACHFYDC